MTTGTLFNQLKAGKITKEQFLYEVRRDQNLPFISPVTSFNDAIQILQNRGIVTEVFEMGPAEGVSKCECGGTYEPHEDAGEIVCDSCGGREPMAEDVHSAEDVTAKLAQDALTGNMNEEGYMGTSYDSSEDMAVDMMKKGITMEGDVCQHCGQAECECSGTDDEYDPFYDREEEINYGVEDDETTPRNHDEFDEADKPSLREQVQEFVKKAMEGGSTMDEAKKQAREYFSKEPAALNEGVKLTIDTVNPYEFKKGVNIEMGVDKSAAPDWSSYLGNLAGDIQKAQAKVLKNLAKDPAYYTNMIAGKKKEKVVKTVWDGYTKGKLAVEDKANVTNKKQKATKVAGVKTMPDKGVTGTEKVIKEDKTAKIREYVKAQLKKEIVQVKDEKGDTVKLAADKNTADKFVKSQDPQVQKKLKVTGQ